MKKQKSTPSKYFGDVVHNDIGFGPVLVHGDINFVLMNNIHPLKTHKRILHIPVFQSCTLQLGVTQKVFYTDFKLEIFAGRVHTWLENKEIKIQTVQPKKKELKRSCLMTLANDCIHGLQLEKHIIFTIKNTGCL